MHNSSNKSKGYMPVSSGPNMTGFDMGKTSSMMDMMQEGGLTPMSSYQRSFTRPRTPGAALLARALQGQKDRRLLEDYQRAEADRQRKGGLFGSIGGLAGGLLGAALSPFTGGASLALASGLGSTLGSGLGQSLGAGKSRAVDRSGTVFGQQAFRDVEQASRDFTKGIGERALVSGLRTAAMAGLSPVGGIYGKVSGRLNPSSISSLTEFSSGVAPTTSGSVVPASSEFGDAIAQGTPLEGTLVDESFVDVAVPEFDTSLTDVSDIVIQPTIEESLLDAARTAQTARSQAMQTSDEMQRLIDYLSRGEEIGFVPFGRNAGLPFGSFEDGGLIGYVHGGLTHTDDDPDGDGVPGLGTNYDPSNPGIGGSMTATEPAPTSPFGSLSPEQILEQQGLRATPEQLALFQGFDTTGVDTARVSAGQNLLNMTGGEGLSSIGGGFGGRADTVSQSIDESQQSFEGLVQGEVKDFGSQVLGTAADIISGGGEFELAGAPTSPPSTSYPSSSWMQIGTDGRPYVWTGSRWTDGG